MVKKHTISDSLEDYLEAILELTEDGEVARGVDIATALGVRPASVTSALKALAEKGLVDYRRGRHVRLTDEGKDAAQKVATKHAILRAFFEEVLGVDAGEAKGAACRAEHVLGSEITTRLLSFVMFLDANREKTGDDLVARFREHCSE
jgi:DtxR family Mn-dependent transcriptional regulator